MSPIRPWPATAEFFKGMYAFYNKDALIIDERYNGGGFSTDVMIDMLAAAGSQPTGPGAA